MKLEAYLWEISGIQLREWKIRRTTNMELETKSYDVGDEGM